jgi:hypothetical protein
MELLTYISPYGSTYEVGLVMEKYYNGCTKLSMISPTEGPIAVISVNVQDTPCVEVDEILVKDYSENEGIFNWMKENNLIAEHVCDVRSGYVRLPYVYLNMDEVNKHLI